MDDLKRFHKHCRSPRGGSALGAVANNTPAPDAQLRYLNALFEGLSGVVELRAIDPERKAPTECRLVRIARRREPGGDWVGGIDQIPPEIARLAADRPGWNLYVALATRRDSSSGKEGVMG